jgi:hypothetical protein
LLEDCWLGTRVNFVEKNATHRFLEVGVETGKTKQRKPNGFANAPMLVIVEFRRVPLHVGQLSLFTASCCRTYVSQKLRNFPYEMPGPAKVEVGSEPFYGVC